jgi:hypothetical protein
MNHDDLQILIQAIEKLKPEDSLIKDYIYPIVLAFVSAIMGGFVGYLGILKRSYQEDEKAKINATNKLLLAASDCFHNLLAIKLNYQGKLTDKPLQRLFCVPPILMYHSPFNPEFAGLFFLAKESSKIAKILTPEEMQDSFTNIPRIKLIFENYNTALEMWKTRNELVPPIFKEIVSDHSATGVAKVNFQDVVKSIGYAKIAQLINLNEQVLSITDDLLADLMKLMNELPKIAKPLISKSVMKKYGDIFRFEFNPQIQATALNRVPVNKNDLEKILGE